MGKFIVIWVCLVVLLGFSELAIAGNDENLLYKDPKEPIENRIKDLVKRMNLAEKIGQMVQLERANATPQIMKDFSIGSLMSAGGSSPRINATAKDWVEMVNELQKGSLSSRLGIPMIYGIDAIHGHSNAYKATIFPHNIGLGATWDSELVRKIGEATAIEVRATGIPYVFAPCVAVCRDPRWGRCYESYSEDTSVVRQMAGIVNGLQGNKSVISSLNGSVPFVMPKDKVAGCAKHFVGDGGTSGGVNEGHTVIAREEMLGIHMPPYYDSIINGVLTIMISYSSWNGIKMHVNHELITDFLKGTLQFKGFVISDWQGLDRITSPPHSNYTYSVFLGVQAGIDMVIVPFNHREFIDTVTNLVEKKFIPMSRIDDAVSRILRVKFGLGLFENPLADLSLADQLGCKAHRELAREAVRKSLVLLKNEATPLLPLPKKAKKILVAGTHADNLGYQCGGWTISWQGHSGNNHTVGTTILSGIRATVDPSTEVVFKENPDTQFVNANEFDYGVVVIGEPPYAETAGDSANLTISEPGPTIITNVCKNVKCVVVVISGRPLVIKPYLSSIHALVAAWLPGTEGQGVADVLFGDYPFTGKLPRTWFKSVDQLPMNYGDLHYDPLYPLGFGLSTNAAVASH